MKVCCKHHFAERQESRHIWSSLSEYDLKIQCLKWWWWISFDLDRHDLPLNFLLGITGPKCKNMNLLKLNLIFLKKYIWESCIYKLTVMLQQCHVYSCWRVFGFHKHTNYLQRQVFHQHLASGARGDFIRLLGLKISLASVSNLTPGTLKTDTADGEREKVREREMTEWQEEKDVSKIA